MFWLSPFIVEFKACIKGLTCWNASVAGAVAGVCGCRWLRFLVLLSDMYDNTWLEIGVFDWFVIGWLWDTTAD